MPANSHSDRPDALEPYRRLLGFWRSFPCMLLCSLFGLASPATAASLQSALEASDQAEAAIRTDLHPPPQRLNLAEMGQWEYAFFYRQLAQERARQALDALRQMARNSADADTARRALVVLGKSGSTQLANELFAARAAAATGAQAAAFRRHGVALADFPRWVRWRTHPGWRAMDEPAADGPLIEPRLLQTYRTVVALDPQDAWSWVTLAWLEGQRAHPDLFKKSEPAMYPNSPAAPAWIEQFVLWLAGRGQTQAALKLCQDAVNEFAKGRMDPELNLAWTHAMIIQGGLYLQMGQLAPARALFQRALEERQARVRAAPDDTQLGLGVVAAYTALAATAKQGNDAKEHARQWWRADELLRELHSRQGSTVVLGRSAWFGLQEQAVQASGVLTLVLGVVLLAAYRHRVARWMRAASDTVPMAPALSAAQTEPSPLVIQRISADTAQVPSGDLQAWMQRARWRASAWQFGAALAFAVAAAGCLLFVDAGFEFAPLRFVMAVVVRLWPVVIVLLMLWAGDLRRGLAAVGICLAIFLALCTYVAFSSTRAMPLPWAVLMPGFDTLMAWAGRQGTALHVDVAPFFLPLAFWWLHGRSSLFLLLFLNRRIRAIGPVLLLLILALSAGAVVALVLSSTVTGTSLVAHAVGALGVPAVAGGVTLVLATGALAALPLAWLLGRGVMAAWRRKWVSDQTLVFDSIWLHQTAMLCINLAFTDTSWTWLGVLPFAAYKMVTLASGWRQRAAARAIRPASLLLLRVFGQQRRSERLFDALQARWRDAGPVQLIGATDLATRTIKATDFFAFLGGRLRSRFLIESTDLQRRLAEIDLLPDMDGRYRVNDVFCGTHAWKAAVLALMRSSDLVAMDLRGFSPSNQGCLFELRALCDLVPWKRVVLIVDASTDEEFLRTSLQSMAQTVDSASPNARVGGSLRWLVAGRSDAATVDSLVTLAGQAGHRDPGAAQSHLSKGAVRP